MPYIYKPSDSDELVYKLQLSQYTNRFELEYVNCPLCSESMRDYYDFETWPYGFLDFEREFREIATRMIDAGMIDAGNPKMRLRGDISERQRSILICPTCGWWAAIDRAVLPAIRFQLWQLNLVSTASLIDFDPSDISAPVEEARRYLCRCYEARHSLHPRLFERTVASVFRDIGFEAEATAYSNDGGIDIVLRSGDERIAVQVKRRQRSIEVEQIRSFFGALLLGGFTRGILVSASKFQRGAIQAAESACRMLTPIELVDPERFLNMLGIAQRNNAADPDCCGFHDTPSPPAFLHSLYYLSSL